MILNIFFIFLHFFSIFFSSHFPSNFLGTKHNLNFFIQFHSVFQWSKIHKENIAFFPVKKLQGKPPLQTTSGSAIRLDLILNRYMRKPDHLFFQYLKFWKRLDSIDKLLQQWLCMPWCYHICDVWKNSHTNVGHPSWSKNNIGIKWELLKLESVNWGIVSNS